MSLAKHWCFTLNNYSDNDEAAVAKAFEAGGIVYLIYGRETASTGTPHLQGFVSLKNKKRLSWLVKSIGQAHYEVARNIGKSIEYCRKEGDYTEFGSHDDVLLPLKSKGKRSDLESFKESVKGGMCSFKDLRETHPECMARYPRFCLSYVRDNKPKPPCPDHPLYDWQQQVVDFCDQPPDSRTVMFVVDPVGNKGKTHICNVLESKYGAQIMKCGKRDDMAFELEDDPKIVCIDVSRSSTEFLNYQFLEDIKDGRVFSPKYESYTKRFNSPHLLVFMNEAPDMTKLSRDRYLINTISE